MREALTEETAAATISQSAANREAGRLTRSSSARGGPAEGAMTLRLMTDHAVGGIDGFVGRGAGQPADDQPEQRRHHAVGEILG